jgi:hypothetical protein
MSKAIDRPNERTIENRVVTRSNEAQIEKLDTAFRISPNFRTRGEREIAGDANPGEDPEK